MGIGLVDSENLFACFRELKLKKRKVLLKNAERD